MSAQQLATRLHVTQPAVAKMEKTEAAGAISVGTLQKAAEAMGCRLVYAFVPQDSFDAFLRARATRVAQRLLDRIEHTMALEAQEGSAPSKEKRVRELADELVRNLSREIWEEASPHSGSVTSGNVK